MKKVIVYSTPACPYCALTKEFLEKNNISFEDLNIASNPQARDDMIKKSGQLGVPVIDIDGEIIVGFNEAKLKELLGLK